MSHLTNAQALRTFTLPADAETDLLFDAEGMDVRHAAEVVIYVEAGAQPIDTLTRYRRVGTREVPDPANYGPVPANEKKRFAWRDVRGTSLRLTGTSADGTTAAVEASAYDD